VIVWNEGLSPCAAARQSPYQPWSTPAERVQVFSVALAAVGPYELGMAEEVTGTTASAGARRGLAPQAVIEWLIGGVVCLLACFVAGHFFVMQGILPNTAPKMLPLYPVFPSLFEPYLINGEAIKAWKLTAGSGFFIALAVAFLILARLLLDKYAAFWMRGLLFALSFGGGLLAMPILAGFGLIEEPKFSDTEMLLAFAWVGGATAVAIFTSLLWQRVLPACAIYAVAFGLGLAALRVIKPLEWDPVIYTSLAWLAVCLLAGHLFMVCWETYLPRRAHFSIALVVGLTLLGLLTELLAMAHLFSRWPIIAAALALLIVLAVAAKWRQNRPLPGEYQDASERLRTARRDEAVERYGQSLLSPSGRLGTAVYYGALGLVYVITALTFYHGAGYAETYWDSLILYLGYARMIFLEGAYPFKAVAQVGIGLGANYPHLYSTLAATGPALAGRWSEIGGQIAAPLAGAVSCLLAYHIVLRMTRREMTAMLAALLFRAVPLGVIYSIYASDYAFALLFTVAFIYLAILYIETAVPGYLVGMTIVCAGASHINYLMLALWGLWALTIALAHARLALKHEDIQVLRREAEEQGRVIVSDTRQREIQEGQILADEPLTYAENYPRVGLRELLRSKWFWNLTAAGLLMASTWHIRNAVLTGNPVYAFFPKVFDGIHINPLVLESATHEWRTNGVGIARVADNLLNIPFEDLTVWDKVRATPWFFYSYFQAWQWEPFLFAWVIPGIALAIIGGIRRALPRRAAQPRRAELDSATGLPVEDAESEAGQRRRLALRIGDVDRVSLLGLVALGGFLFYHIAVADFYVYQILPALAVWPIFFCHVFETARQRPWRQIMAVLVFVTAICPGLATALIGFKLTSARDVLSLAALRQPGMKPVEVIRLRYGADADMIEEVNTVCLKSKVLTHENRHLLFDPTITLVHLDDWEVQQLWGKPPDEAMEGLKQLGVAFYLRVPNEANHRVNEFLGMSRLIAAGRLKLLGKWGENELYAL